MAEALVSIALEKLTDVVGQQLSLFIDATDELEKLSSTFESIQAVLADAEGRQVGDQSVKRWLSRLRHVAYDIQDLLDEEPIPSLGDEEGNEDDGNHRKKPRWSFSFFNTRSNYAPSRHQVARDITEIRERLDLIDVERNRFSFNSNTQGGDQRELIRSQRITTSLKNNSEIMIGRENDKEQIISRLMSESSHEDGGQAHVVAIFGIGGLGKTTLAREIYNDGRVQGHFNGDLYWVCVSEVFDVIRLTKAILEQVQMTVSFPSEPDALQKELLEALRGKHFLLVLDDVWNDDAKKWNMLQLPLNGGAQGSRILVTTRGRKVTKTMKATYIHELQGLSDDDSWELFRSRAFAERTPEECSKLENVGRQIVSKCRGVPLAITVMGSAMNSKRAIADWQSILDSKMWSLRDAENEILPALWVSYYNLQPQLKQCFAYCSMFPKDWVLEKDLLVRLWAAQGFIRSDGNRNIEDIGADYFDDLVAWSIFQEVKKCNRKIICKMHDLLHDLAESIAKDEIYTFIEKSEQCPIAISNVRHSFLSFTGSTDDEFNKIPIALGRATKLRTLFLHRLYRIDKFIVEIFCQARFVRAIVFSSYSIGLKWKNAIVELPKAIGHLKHLRYLDLSGLNIVELPESVSDLRHLHTLNLTHCGKLEKLPRGLGRMVSLRHLEIEWTDNLKYLPKGLGRISGLQSLCKFIVGGGDEGEGCGIEELQRLNSLQGSLAIQQLERASSREAAEKAELWNKQYLCSLDLKMSAERHDDAETGTIDSIVEGLRPHENLGKLEMHGFTGSKLPSWMNGMRHLQNLVLFCGPKLEWVPHLPSLRQFQICGLRNEILPDEGWEQLAALQELQIYNCFELKCLPEGLTQLSSLEQLDIWGCDKLESLPEGLGQLKKLKKLDVGGSKMLTSLPNSLGQLASLEHLSIQLCEKLESLPISLGQLKKLNSLYVSGSEVLRCVPDSVGQLESLESLCIGSKKLESLPDSLGHLKTLESLNVSHSEVLRCIPNWLGQLESLKDLRFYDLKKLESLPNSVVQLKKLKALRVGGSEVLMCLPDWVGQLDSLQELDIRSWKKLESLPDSLEQLKVLNRLQIEDCEALASLPQGVLRHLSSLSILNCPLLQERYKMGGGVDWPNISHIPTVRMNDECFTRAQKR